MNNNTLKLLEEFNRYFTSSNDVDVSARINVSRDEWRQLYKNLKEQNTQQVPMTDAQRTASWFGSPVDASWASEDAYNQGIQDAEAHHGITTQCVNTTKKGGM